MVWSDRYRLPLALICVLWLSFMGWRYAGTVTDRVGWIEQCDQDKASCDGRQVFLSLVEVIALREDGYTVRKVNRDWEVDGDPAGRELGETISVVARFSAAEDELRAVEVHEHPWRPWKVWLGLGGLALAAGFAFTGLRVQDRRLASRG
ncbi:MAG TPA: hypothetical protein QGF58_22445 [Myxococcota bacterium]|nr:hypothetical protein [Myxococcota bacterium]